MSSLAYSFTNTVQKLSRTEKIRFFLSGLALGLTSILDLAGLALLTAGVAVITSALTGRTESSFGVRIIPLLNSLGLVSGPNFALEISVLVICFFLAKAAASSLLNLVNNRWFADIEVKYSLALANAYFKRTTSSPENQTGRTVDAPYALTFGTVALFSRSLNAISGVIADSISALTILVVLVIASPQITLLAIAYLGLVSSLLIKVIGRYMHTYGQRNTVGLINARRTLSDFEQLREEALLAGKQDYFLGKFEAAKRKAVEALANAITLSQVPRHVVEISLVLGSFALSAFEFRTSPPSTAAVTISLFLVASFRLTPSLLSIINNIGTLRQMGEDAKTVDSIKVL